MSVFRFLVVFFVALILCASLSPHHVASAQTCIEYIKLYSLDYPAVAPTVASALSISEDTVNATLVETNAAVEMHVFLINVPYEVACEKLAQLHQLIITGNPSIAAAKIYTEEPVYYPPPTTPAPPTTAAPPTTPPNSESTSPRAAPPSSDSLSMGSIVGLSIGCAIIGLLLVFVFSKLYVAYYERKAAQKKDERAFTDLSNTENGTRRQSGSLEDATASSAAPSTTAANHRRTTQYDDRSAPPPAPGSEAVAYPRRRSLDLRKDRFRLEEGGQYEDDGTYYADQQNTATAAPSAQSKKGNKSSGQHSAQQQPQQKTNKKLEAKERTHRAPAMEASMPSIASATALANAATEASLPPPSTTAAVDTAPFQGFQFPVEGAVDDDDAFSEVELATPRSTPATVAVDPQHNTSEDPPANSGEQLPDAQHDIEPVE